MTVRVLIADNHPIFRSGLRQVIEDIPDHAVVGEAADGDACIAQTALIRPDIVTVDLNMPGRSGFEVVEWIVKNVPDCRVVVVSMYADKAFVEKIAESGGHAFVAKEDAGSELAMAFEKGADAFYMSSAAGSQEPPLRLARAGGSDIGELLARLTFTEGRVLGLVASSRTSRDIARALGISERTVHSHRNNICAKLGIHGANALLHFAVNNKSAILARAPGRL